MGLFMETEITLQIILVKPTKDVDFGLQKGSGNDYENNSKTKIGWSGSII
jgi:hypothetical protein